MIRRPTSKLLPPTLHPAVRSMASAITVIIGASSASLAILANDLAAAAIPPAVLFLISGFVAALGMSTTDDNFRKAVGHRPVSMYDRVLCAITVCAWWALVCVGIIGPIAALAVLSTISTKTRVVALIAVLAAVSVRRILKQPSPDPVELTAR